MKRTEWLIQLEQELTRLGVANPRGIVADYEEHFSAGADAGKTEEQVSEKLGDPRSVAKAHQAESLVTQAVRPGGGPADMTAVSRATLRLLLLTPFNFLMLVGPCLILSIFLFVGWVLAAVFGVLSLGAVGIGLLAIPLLIVNFWGAGAFFFGTLAFAGFSVLAIMTMWVVSRWVILMFISYLRWNVDFVLEKRGSNV